MGNLATNKLDICSLLFLLTIASTVLVSQMPGGNTVNFAVTGLFIAVAFVVALIEKRPFRLFPPFIILALWLCFAMISSLTATDLALALERVIQMIQILVLVTIATNVIIWSGRSHAFILVFVSAALLSYGGSLAGFGFGVVDESLIAERSGDRVRGLTTNANEFGTLMVQAQLALVLFGVQFNQRYTKYLMVAAFMLLGVAVIHSGSRTAFVGMIVLIVGCGWVFRIWRFKNASKAMGLLLLAIVFVSVAYVSLEDNRFVRDRVESFLSSENISARYGNLLALVTTGGDVDETDTEIEGSISTRVQYARYSWEAAVSLAPFGMGLHNFTVAYGGYAHSNYFEILATTGFVGLILFISIYICMYMRAFRLSGNRHENPLLIRVFIICITVLIIMDLATVTYYSKPFWLFVAIAIASVEVSQGHRKMTS